MDRRVQGANCQLRSEHSVGNIADNRRTSLWAAVILVSRYTVGRRFFFATFGFDRTRRSHRQPIGGRKGMDSLLRPTRPDSDHTHRLLDRAAAGDTVAACELLARHRPAMVAFVGLHLDPRLAGRLDPSDVVQEAQADIARRLNDFLHRRPMPFHLWAKKTAYERLLDARRRHLGRARRAVGREERLPDQSSLLLARPLLADGPTPSQAAEAREFEEQVMQAV